MDGQPPATPAGSLARDWRERLLRQAGCEPRLAAAIDLVGRGCPPSVAAHTLAPDRERNRRV